MAMILGTVFGVTDDRIIVLIEPEENQDAGSFADPSAWQDRRVLVADNPTQVEQEIRDFVGWKNTPIADSRTLLRNARTLVEQAISIEARKAKNLTAMNLLAGLLNHFDLTIEASRPASVGAVGAASSEMMRQMNAGRRDEDGV
jgi:hypothetical protein